MRIEKFLNNFLENEMNFKPSNKSINGNGAKKVKNEILKSFNKQNK